MNITGIFPNQVKIWFRFILALLIVLAAILLPVIV